jgi:hypothetical protein
MLDEGVASASEETRARAVESLGLLVKNDRARKLAESALKDQDPSVRAAAATALGQIGLKAATAALTSALHDTEAGVVFASASSLLQLGDATAYRVYYAVLTGERKTGEPLLESQLKMLKDPEALARIGFEQGIGFIPFGGIGLTVFKSFRADNVSPVRAACGAATGKGSGSRERPRAGDRDNRREVARARVGGERGRGSRRSRARVRGGPTA